MEPAALSTIKDWSIVLAGAIALVTFVTGTLEYRRRGRYERAQNFVEIRRRFLDSQLFRENLHLLTADDPALAELPVQNRRSFIGYLEEVALMVESGLLDPGVASYTFGYYVRLVAESKNVWVGLDPESRYWEVFHRFATTMRQVESHPSPRRLPTL